MGWIITAGILSTLIGGVIDGMVNRKPRKY